MTGGSSSALPTKLNIGRLPTNHCKDYCLGQMSSWGQENPNNTEELC